MSEHDNQVAVAAWNSRKAAVWDLESRSQVRVLECDYSIGCLEFLAGGALVAAGRLNQQFGATIWGLQTGHESRFSLPRYPYRLFPGRAGGLAFRGDGDYRFRHFAENGKEQASLDLEDDGVLGIPESFAVHPDDEHAAIGTRNGRIAVVDLDTMHLVAAPLEQGEARVSSVAFSPDGSQLVSTGFDATVRIWDVRDLAKPVLLFTLHRPVPPWKALFSPGGEFLATVGGDTDLNDKLTMRHIGDVCLWDPHTGQLLANFSGHSEMVHNVSFSANGKWLITCGRDSRVRVWSVAELLKFGASQPKSEA